MYGKWKWYHKLFWAIVIIGLGLLVGYGIFLVVDGGILVHRLRGLKMMKYPGIEEDQPFLDIDEVKRFLKDEWLMLAKRKIDVPLEVGDSGLMRFSVLLTENWYKITFTKLVMGPLGKPITIYEGASIGEAVKYYNGERTR